jgi:hypothetical protein
MTKSFLINTSVAAIVSAFVFTPGVSSARAWDDSYREASSNRGPLYYPNRDTWGNHGGHYPKRYSRNPYDSYGSFGGYPRESYDQPGRPVYRSVMDASWNGGSRYGDNWNGYRGR